VSIKYIKIMDNQYINCVFLDTGSHINLSLACYQPTKCGSNQFKTGPDSINKTCIMVSYKLLYDVPVFILHCDLWILVKNYVCTVKTFYISSS